MATASPFITALGDFATFSGQYGTPMIAIFTTMVEYAFYNDWMSGKLTNEAFLYLWANIIMISNFVCAAWVATKATAAAISFIDGFAFNYRNYSVEGNRIAIYELVYAILYIGTAFIMVVFSYVTTDGIWETMEAREKAVAEDGLYGHAVSPHDIFHVLVIGVIVAFAHWITAYSMGETVDELIGWYDEWSDPTSNDSDNEGSDKNSGTIDIAGTSISYDGLYHAITVFYSWFVFTAILVGALNFGSTHIGFKPVEDCDLDEVNQSTYANVAALVASQTTVDTCKQSVLTIFNLADLNNDGVVTRCENAKFLYGVGNSEEYALNYSMAMTLPSLFSNCYTYFSE